MFGKQKSSTAVDQPDGWNDAMLADLLGKRRSVEGTINVLLMVDEAQKQFELRRGTKDEQVRFTARIAAKDGSPLGFARAHIRFCEVQTYGRTAAVPSDAAGLLFLSQSEQIGGGPQIPLIEVMLFGGAESQLCLERCLASAQQFHAEFVPVWIWVASESLPTTAAGALQFSIENQLPISRCNWQQILHLGGSVPQDDFLT